jgi:phosphoheptose isomerase
MSNLTPEELVRQRLMEHQKVREVFFSRSLPDLILVARKMSECIRAQGKILICGNGGSASDSLHFSGEMIGRFMRERRPLPALALPADVATLTAIGNDYGFDHVFSRGVEAFGKKGDLLFALSTSGQSPNILRAAEKARDLGLGVVALTGKDGGALAGLADFHLNVSEGKTSAAIQEVHIQVIHLLVELMDTCFPVDL